MTCSLQWYSLLQTSMKPMHPCKSYWVETNINITIKTRSKRVINRPKFCGWLPILNLTFILQWYTLLQTSDEIVHPFQTYWTETNILTQQQNLSRKRVITPPRFGGWLPISNFTCILQWCKTAVAFKRYWGKRKVWRQFQRRRRRDRTTWPLCVCHATQLTQ